MKQMRLWHEHRWERITMKRATWVQCLRCGRRKA